MGIPKKKRPAPSVKPKPPSANKRIRRGAWKSLEGSWQGLFDIPDEILMADTSHLWECVTDPDRVLNPERKSD